MFSEFSVIEGINESNISVIELNTLVQGYLLDEMGNPLMGTVWGETVISNEVTILKIVEV